MGWGCALGRDSTTITTTKKSHHTAGEVIGEEQCPAMHAACNVIGFDLSYTEEEDCAVVKAVTALVTKRRV